MGITNRKFSSNNYRYGFNGKEQDKETTGTSTYDYGFRIYNPALGRFLSVDPLTKSYPWYTPYQFAGNKPIIAIDLDGLEEKVVVNSWLSKVKPAIQSKNAIGLFEELETTQYGVNFIMSQLQIKEVQQKSLVGPPKYMNPEFQDGYLTLQASEKIIEETIYQFTIQTVSRYSSNQSVDKSIVTETYNVNFDFDYSLLGDESTISKVKDAVSKVMTVTEYAGDIFGSDMLNKVSSKGGIVSDVLNKDYLSLTQTAVTTAAEKLLSNNNSFLTTIFKKAAPKVAGGVVNILALTLSNSASQENVVDARAKRVEELRNRTIAALLIYFETGNKTKAGPPIINPTNQDNTHLPQPIITEPIKQ